MPEPSRKASLTVIFFAVFIDLLGFGMVLPLLPLYGDEFAAALGIQSNSAQMGLLLGALMASFSAMQFLFAPVWGRVSDRIGRRPVLLIGLSASAIAYYLFAVATTIQSVPLLFVSRIGAGIAGATISTAQAYIADVTSKESRTKGMALVGAAFGLGFTFGPLLGYFALNGKEAAPGPGPGYAAASLSAAAFLLAYFKLAESHRPGTRSGHVREPLDVATLRSSLATRSIAPILLAIFLCVFAFANFESTLAQLVNDEAGPFNYSFREVLLVFAFVGLTLTLAQGLLVRRLAGRVSEGRMAFCGSIAEVVGFGLLASSVASASHVVLFCILALIVVGFSMVTPSLNALLSRRSDPARQGSVLGVAQSVSSLARILGPMVGLPLYKNAALAESLAVARGSTPFWLAGVLMAFGGVLVLVAAGAGQDYPSA
jgi:MFS family permease